MSSRDSKHGNTQKPSRPERTTRGKRIELDEDEVAADGEFWDQQFFAEDAVDMDFKSDDEKEVEDVPDSDFDESVSIAIEYINLVECFLSLSELQFRPATK